MSESNATVAVVIPNWNGERLLRDCLNGVLRQTHRAFSVVVVDDASTDGSVDLLQREFPWVTIIEQPARRGFCAAVNVGIQATTSHYVALLNNDAMPEAGWLAESRRGLERGPKYAGCAPKILFLDRPSVVNSAGIYLRRDGASRDIGYGHRDSAAYDQPAEVYGFSGCAVLLRRSAIEDVGLFDEDLVAYAEDLDWCLRARLRGYRFTYQPAARVLHRTSSTFTQVPLESEYYRNRNSLWVLVKNLPFSLLLRNAPELAVFQCYQLFVAGKHKRFRTALAAKQNVFACWRQLLHSRRSAHAGRRLHGAEAVRALTAPSFVPAERGRA